MARVSKHPAVRRDELMDAALQLCVDIGYHMAITGWNQGIFDEMAQVVDRGITSFKHFMAYKGALMVNDDEMFASFRRLGELGGIALVHALAAARGRGGWLGLFYAALLVLAPLKQFIVVLAAMDSWLDIRGRWLKKPGG